MTLEELDRLKKGKDLDSKIKQLVLIVKDFENDVFRLGGVKVDGCGIGPEAMFYTQQQYEDTINTKAFKDELTAFVKDYLKRKIESYQLEFEKL